MRCSPRFHRIALVGMVCASIIVGTPAEAAIPTATPAGQGTIAFVSDDTGVPMLMTMEPGDGTSANALTNGLAPDRGSDSYTPVWSPDSSQIAFVACDKNSLTACMLYVMNDDGSLVKQVTTQSAQYEGISWSPDGKWLVYASSLSTTATPHFYVVASDGSDSPKPLGASPLSGAWPSWSPDGAKIVYQTVGSDTTGISIMNADGTDSQSLTNLPNAVDLDPVWSPDGKSIAFVRGIKDKYALYLMDANGQNVRHLTGLFLDSSPKATEHLKLPALTWSPDGQFIAFNSHQGSKWELERVDVKSPTNVRRLLSVSAEAFSPSWSSYEP